jgi:hypothetical protein
MANDFKPTIGGKVLKSDAEAWIKKYDDEKKDKAKDTTSVFFGKDFLHEILRTEGAAGISFFLAKKYSEFAGKDVVDLVLVPRKEDGTLLWPPSDGKDGNSSAYDNGKTCPPLCS